MDVPFSTTSMLEKVSRIHKTYLLDQQLFCWRHFSKTEVVQNTDLNILALQQDKPPFITKFSYMFSVIPFYRFHKMCNIEMEILDFKIKLFDFFSLFVLWYFLSMFKFFGTLVEQTQPPCNRFWSYVAFSSGIAILDTWARFIYKCRNRNGNFAPFTKKYFGNILNIRPFNLHPEK